MEWTNEQKNTLNLVTIHSLIFVDIHLAYENVQSHHYAFCISWLQKLQAKLTKRWGCVFSPFYDWMRTLSVLMFVVTNKHERTHFDRYKTTRNKVSQVRGWKYFLQFFSFSTKSHKNIRWKKKVFV